MNLKHTPCDCAEWRRLNEACADLLAERDDAKRLMYKAHQDHCHCEHRLAKVTAERDEWKQRAKDMYQAAEFLWEESPHQEMPDIEEAAEWFNNA